ncbi:MAG: transcriptional regulator [Leucobacter sp.]
MGKSREFQHSDDVGATPTTTAEVPLRPPTDLIWGSEHDDAMISSLKELVVQLGDALLQPSEVVLHDLRALPNSIVAIRGDVTGRKPGDPATDVLLRRMVSGDPGSGSSYATVLPDGRRLRSTTTILRNGVGVPLAAICVNTDISNWIAVAQAAQGLIGIDGAEGEPESARVESDEAEPQDRSGELFAHDIDELSEQMLLSVIKDTGVPVDLMHKRHKISVVRQLRERGFFLLKEAVEMCASALQVTRFTIYNYINEIESEERIK